MKFQKTPLILLFSALLLGGYVYFSELKKGPQPQIAQIEAKPIFAFKEAEIQAFTAKSDRTLSTPIARQAEFGLNPPSETVEVKLDNQQTHRLLLGKPNFNCQFLYALADPTANPSQNLAVLQVAID